MNSETLTKTENLWTGKWTKVNAKTFEVGEKTIVWECVERTTTTSSGIDGVNTIATFVDPETNENKIVLIANYRPPVEKYCVEWPAGLMDPGEDVKTTALRELFEETGYRANEADVQLVTTGGCLAAPFTNEMG